MKALHPETVSEKSFAAWERSSVVGEGEDFFFMGGGSEESWTLLMECFSMQVTQLWKPSPPGEDSEAQESDMHNQFHSLNLLQNRIYLSSLSLIYFSIS